MSGLKRFAHVVAGLSLLGATTLSTWYHWYPPDAPAKHVALVLLVGGTLLYWLLRRRLTAALILTCVAVQVLSEVHSGRPLFLVEGLGSSGLLLLLEDAPVAKVRPRIGVFLVGAGFVLAVHAIVGFILYRLWGPLPSHPWMALWLYPYNSGVLVPSWRLCGLFMNENLFGIWCASLIPIVLQTVGESTRPWEKRFCWLTLGLLIACCCWSYSRMVAILLTVVLLLHARRYPREVAAIALAAPLLAMAFWTRMDQMRFLHPLAPGFYPSDRIASWAMAWETLAHGSLLGTGPGSGGLRDAQFAKLIVETGWLGLAAWASLLGWLLHGKRDDNAFRLAAIVVLIGGASADLLESPHIALVLWTYLTLDAKFRRSAAAPVPLPIRPPVATVAA
ncbi:MAG: hypothetical protein ACYCW6_06750 [Candidatus Xenobia bacterium]